MLGLSSGLGFRWWNAREHTHVMKCIMLHALYRGIYCISGFVCCDVLSISSSCTRRERMRERGDEREDEREDERG